MPDTTTIDFDRQELRERARRAMSHSPDNEYIRGWRAAWTELLRLMDEQDAMRHRTES